MFLQQWQSEQGHRTERRRMMRMLRAEEKEGQAKRRRHVGGVTGGFLEASGRLLQRWRRGVPTKWHGFTWVRRAPRCRDFAPELLTTARRK